MPEVARCSMQGCGAAIIWTTSPNGAKLCLDSRPVTVYFIDDAEPPNAKPAPVKRRKPGPNGEEVIEDVKVYISHWLTCKNPPRRK